MAHVLVTGADGFIGKSLCLRLEQEHVVRRSVRRHAPENDCLPVENVAAIGDIDAVTDWGAALAGVEVVVHTAARVHIMKEERADPAAQFQRVNTAGTLNLARQAAVAEVRRFIFLSTIKVNGEQSVAGQPFNATDCPAPEDPYAVSKHAAEKGLQQLGAETGMEIVIIRPPLVYGAGVKGNFATLIKLIEKRVPLPLGAIHNKRSLVGLDNLVDLIATCIKHPAAANQIFLAGDGEDLSTSELLRRLAQALGKAPLLLPIPATFLEFGAKLLGKQAVAQRVLGSLQVDICKARDLLGWTPPVNVDEGLRRAVGSCSQSPCSYLREQTTMIRFFDILFAAFGLIFGLPVLLLISVIGYFDTGSALFFQERMGRAKRPFVLVKFRTMHLGTESVASHLANSASITAAGRFLRKTKLDELPQLWNVLKGEMSLVGPRPNLLNQAELIAQREALGVYGARPGITGLAQVEGIDMSTPELLAQTDAKMLQELNLSAYFRYIFMTLSGRGAGDRVR
ncbi:MAG: sugar transferase [Desulfuromonas sp.]|nr:sugar transferase [Desulfuromonas sp.]